MMKVYVCNVYSRLVVKEKTSLQHILEDWSTEKTEGFQTSKNVATGM